MKILVVNLASLLLAQAANLPAAVQVGDDCRRYAETHTLVRDDVLAGMDASDKNLEAAERALKIAQEDLDRATKAIDELNRQKKALLEHSDRLEKMLADRPPLDAAWETIDAPAGFIAGAGACIAIVWGLGKTP